ncbi:hypothetical protein [Saccharopolyspora pogona]|uniref:hypothetical protein n=1 Tax=Saccharopolyspora pogona TaxID=333966 RepID=UPI001CC2557C|nr:hypothetical protein [Saccharopolyspora pogona]
MNVLALSPLTSGVLPAARHGAPGQQDELLAGEFLTAALSEPPSSPLPGTPRTAADGQSRVSGTKTGVLNADLARRDPGLREHARWPC